MMRKALLAAAALFLTTAWSAAQPQPDLGSQQQQAAGKVLYDQYCSQCHGENGDGLGLAAPYLKPQPRDFTQGKFKIRTTPTGAVPSHEDLKNIIRRGMPYTSMPEWPQFSDQQLSNLAYHIKAFADDFEDPAAYGDSLQIPSPPSPSEESIQRGRQLYEDMGCIRCHGEAGRGDGTAAREQTDDWGYHLRPADMTKPWTFRGGSERQDVYRTFMTGLNGTPMPSYADEGTLAPQDRWPMVDYVFSLSESPQPNYASLLTAVPAADAIDLEGGLEQFSHAPLARFPIIGQVIEKGRNFYPAVVEVEVRAIYSSEDIALLVEWNDIYAETEGSNDPSLVVPAWDPEAETSFELLKPPAAASTPSASDDPFADQQADPFADAQADPFADQQQADDPFAQDQPAAAAASSVRQTPYSDAVAIQFPQEIPSRNPKPYFIFGDASKPVEVWFTDLANNIPQLYLGRGSVSINPSDSGELYEVKSSYDQGRWSVIFKRKRVSRASISFLEGGFVPIAFSVWDGFNHERGNKRGLTSWFSLYLEPVEKPSVIAPMLQNGLAVLVLQILIIFGVRRKFAQKTGE